MQKIKGPEEDEMTCFPSEAMQEMGFELGLKGWVRLG